MTKNNKFVFLSVLSSMALVMTLVLAPSFAQAADNFGSTTLKVGSKGDAVKALQQLMATNADMYPSQSTDGVFGNNTKNAVIQFQLAYNLTADGLVGLNTRNVANNLIDAGRGVDINAPEINNLYVYTSGKNVNLTFNSNEPVKATVFYDTNSINWNNWDDTTASLQTPPISGMTNTDNVFSTNKQFYLNNLNSNSNYNYTIAITDQSGNTSVIWPNTFRTSQ